MTTKIFYHGGCFDGFTAAWAAWKKFGDTAEYIPVSYGGPLPGVEAGDEVFFLDFCPSVDYLRGLGSSVRLTILDHHKTAQADLELFKPQDGDEIVFDMDRSGAGIAWDYFHMEPRPQLVNYAEDHDLWRYQLPESRAIRAYLHAQDYELGWWDIVADLLENDFSECVGKGYAIQSFMKQQIKMIANNAIMRRLYEGGPLVPCVNATTLFSEVGEELNKRFPDAPYAMYYFDRADGKRQWGLRTKRPDEDVSATAKMFGGGGHKGAAGFTTEGKGPIELTRTCTRIQHT